MDRLSTLDLKLKKARCPVCSDKVFVPSFVSISDDLDDQQVICKDMGHWMGRLSECRFEEEG